MSAVVTALDWAEFREEGAACACQAAVVRSYYTARQRGESANDAIQGAMRIYRHHHPRSSFDAAYAAVAEWVSPKSLN